MFRERTKKIIFVAKALIGIRIHVHPMQNNLSNRSLPQRSSLSRVFKSLSFVTDRPKDLWHSEMWEVYLLKTKESRIVKRL